MMSMSSQTKNTRITIQGNLMTKVTQCPCKNEGCTSWFHRHITTTQFLLMLGIISPVGNDDK